MSIRTISYKKVIGSEDRYEARFDIEGQIISVLIPAHTYNVILPDLKKLVTSSVLFVTNKEIINWSKDKKAGDLLLLLFNKYLENDLKHNYIYNADQLIEVN